MNIKEHSILILDFGSQYTQLIARRVREMGVYCEIHPYTIDDKILTTNHPCGIILSGGPATVTAVENPRAPDWVFACGLPVLGLCYGMQTMAAQLGGAVAAAGVCEFGYAEVSVKEPGNLFKDIADRVGVAGKNLLDVWMSHSDKVTSLPPGFKVLCETQHTAIAAMADESRQLYGIQFHPEVTHTPKGMALLKRFVLEICNASKHWSTPEILEELIKKVQASVGKERVLLALSGGVDSAVVAALLHRAIGDQLVCVFVDNGFLRLNECSQVLTMFRLHLGIDLIAVDASERFLSALKGVSCPEEKRKIIGKTFIQVFESEANRLTNIKFLAQGTIYPDVIESNATVAAAIKSHHNVGGLPEIMQLKLLEPIRELFKDEVRQLGLALGLPHELVYQHPFPGPGLAVRILGAIRPEFITCLRHADAIFIEELIKANLYAHVSQAFAVFLPVKSVGVVGDQRCYAYVICLRAIETSDFMTAHWSHLPWDFLMHVSNRIINEVTGISRVTYDISGKPPATIEWE